MFPPFCQIFFHFILPATRYWRHRHRRGRRARERERGSARRRIRLSPFPVGSLAASDDGFGGGGGGSVINNCGDGRGDGGGIDDWQETASAVLSVEDRLVNTLHADDSGGGAGRDVLRRQEGRP